MYMPVINTFNVRQMSARRFSLFLLFCIYHLSLKDFPQMYNIQIYHSLKKEIKYYTEEITY